MKDNLPILIKAKPLRNYHVRVKYSDGVQGEIDLSKFARRGLFRSRKNYGQFKKVTIGPRGELIWSDELGLDGLEIYLKLTGKNLEEVVSK